MPKATIDMSYMASPIPFIGGGDPDVYTKRGRKTKVVIKVGNLRLSSDGRIVYATVFYSVKELRPDHTHLSYCESAYLGVPGGQVATKILTGGDFNWTHTYQGKNHAWNNVPVSGQYCIDWARARIDGPGDDDQGNAALEVHFNFDVEVK